MPAAAPAGGDLLARRYRLIDRVGAGGMSVVWRARDEVLDRLVAVKWLGSELADDELFRDLVRREAWATARIKHPAVAAVYDYGEVSTFDGQARAYVVMEMLDGESLSERLRLGPLPWRQAVAICAEVADALATTHEQGVVHRDISPDNVMLTTSGLRLFDFGIAAPIGEPDDDATGSTFGTPAYVAPERLDGRPAQTATDVYSLGVLLFEMLTGRPPFPEDTWDSEAALNPRDAPRLRGVSGLPAAVGRLCQRCLAFDPALRPPAREVADRLAAYTRSWWQQRTAVAAAVLLIVTIAVATALLTWRQADPRSPSAGPGTSAPSAGSTGASEPAGPGTTESTGPSTPPGPSASSTGTSTGAPTQTTRPPTATGSAAPTDPVDANPPPVAAIPVDQALEELRAVIETGTASGQIRDDVAQDLRNKVQNLTVRLAFSPAADRTQTLAMVTSLREDVLRWSMLAWPVPGTSAVTARTAIAPDARTKLFAAIDRLKASLE